VEEFAVGVDKLFVFGETLQASSADGVAQQHVVAERTRY
jgi:hypothetical protein